MQTVSIAIVIAIIWIVLAFTPYWIAKWRKHAREDGVFGLCLIGLFVPFVWIAAILWAVIGETRPPIRRIYRPLRSESQDLDESLQEHFERGESPPLIPQARKEIEKCANCDATIGRLETPHVFNDAVVCRACYKKLIPQDR